MYKHACASHETTSINMKEIVDMYKPYIKYIYAINWDMQEHINICHREYEKHAPYPEQSTANFEYIANIIVDGSSVIIQEKNGSEEYHQENTYDENEVNNSIE